MKTLHVISMLSILLLISCTDNSSHSAKQSAQSSEPVEIVEPEPLVASYDNGLDLILVQNHYDGWYGSFIYFQSYVPEPKEIADTLTEDSETFSYEPDPLPIQYTAVYWNSNDNTYYTVKGIQETSNLEYTIDTNLQQEPLLSPIMLEHCTKAEKYKIPDHKFLYVGSLSPLQRAYINAYDTNMQYIKQLEPVTNGYYSISNGFIPLNSPVYPVADEIFNSSTIYTNSEVPILELYLGAGGKSFQEKFIY